MIDYTVKYSRRKTAAIYITRDARVEVRVPYGTGRGWIEQMVREKESWICRRLTDTKRRVESRQAFSLSVGEHFLLLGKDYIIVDTSAAIATMDGDICYLPVGDTATRKRAAINLYRKTAAEILPPLVERYAHIMGVTPRSVSVTGAATSWGSCSGDNRLHFSWRLMMAQEEAVCYVVIHELAHIKEHNHSPRFWEIVYHYAPEADGAREALKELSRRLTEQDWSLTDRTE